MKRPILASLRVRLLLPLLGASAIAAIVVAMVSASLGRRWALQEVQARFRGIEDSLRQPAFPLTPTVVDSLSGLTRTELVTFDELGNVLTSSVTLEANDQSELEAYCRGDVDGNRKDPQHVLQIGDRRFLLFTFLRSGTAQGPETARRVIVLFDQAGIGNMSRRAALLPLATGLSTIILLTTLMIVMTKRLLGRLVNLQDRVERVAAGDFDAAVSDQYNDEVGRLGTAVEMMAGQLTKLWNEVNRQQSQKLLHQLAGGMAHQLRNSLTGARMAIELHNRCCSDQDDEGLDVAIAQLEQLDEYVRRLLLVARGGQEDQRPAEVRECIQDMRSSLGPIAKHLRVDVDWRLSDALAGWHVQDGPTFSAAVTNLILNAIQAGNKVVVQADLTGHGQVRVSVADNGPGVSASIAGEIFEPFVTSKPEGLGLGLPLVRRAAESLDGEVQWRRSQGETKFVLSVNIQLDPTL